MSGYSFPAMDWQEIVAVVREWGFSDLQQSQIASCDPVIIQAVYATILRRVTGITIDKLDNKTDTLVDELGDHGEICAGGISLNLLLFHLQRLAYASRLDSFTLKDLVQPEKSRTLTILSAVINFGKFTEEQVEFVRSVESQSLESVEERDRLRQEIEVMESKLLAIKSQRLAEEPECDDLNQKIGEILAGLSASKETQDKMISEVEKLKREKTSVIERKARIRNEISLAVEKQEKTRARIVNDPERLMRLLKEKANLVQEERTAIAVNEGRARELQARLDSLGGFDQNVRLSIQHLQTGEIEQNHLEAAEKRLLDIRQLLEAKSIERVELSNGLERYRRQWDNANEKLERAQKNAESRRKTSEQTIARLKEEYSAMAAERRETDRHIEETKRQTEEIDRKMQEHLRQNETEMNELLAQYFRLRHQIDLYMETLSDKLGLRLEDLAAA